MSFTETRSYNRFFTVNSKKAAKASAPSEAGIANSAAGSETGAGNEKQLSVPVRAEKFCIEILSINPELHAERYGRLIHGIQELARTFLAIDAKLRTERNCFDMLYVHSSLQELLKHAHHENSLGASTLKQSLITTIIETKKNLEAVGTSKNPEIAATAAVIMNSFSIG